nr:hypothetical protein CFP56_76881 [Quercus suber]
MKDDYKRQWKSDTYTFAGRVWLIAVLPGSREYSRQANLSEAAPISKCRQQSDGACGAESSEVDCDDHDKPLRMGSFHK